MANWIIRHPEPPRDDDEARLRELVHQSSLTIAEAREFAALMCKLHGSEARDGR